MKDFISTKAKSLTLLVIFCTLISCTKEKESWKPEQGKITVLMYHRIVDGKATNLYERSITDLESDLKYIVRNKINVISFTDLESISESGILPAANSVILTFDDGDDSWFTLVRPMLLKYRMKATLFLWVQMIDQYSFLSWNDIELMSNYMYEDGERPFIFGSHTCSHPFLLKRKTDFSAAEYDAYLNYELGESKKIIESHIPGEVAALSLPYGDGFDNPEIIAAAKKNGYKFIRTSKWNSIQDADHNLFTIPAIPVLDKSRMIDCFAY